MILITHRRKDCIGCNSCVEHAPGRWEMEDKDGKSNLLGAVKKGDHYVLKASDDEYEANKHAAQDCPVSIIHVEKKDILHIEREVVDNIDRMIVGLLKKRMHHVEKILETKIAQGKEIEDQVREKEILKNVVKESEKVQLDPQFTQEVFKGVLKNSKVFQERRVFSKSLKPTKSLINLQKNAKVTR